MTRLLLLTEEKLEDLKEKKPRRKKKTLVM